MPRLKMSNIVTIEKTYFYNTPLITLVYDSHLRSERKAKETARNRVVGIALNELEED
jgi:hypothetical protein